MIVKVAGWLYIIQAVLGLSTLVVPMPFYVRDGRFQTLIIGVGMGVLGVGLLQRKTLARWFVLGASFLGWTLGSLIALGLLVLAAYGVAAAGSIGNLFANGIVAFLSFVAFVVLVMSLIGVVINFKLYWYLVSPEGKAEFGAPESDSFATVLASAGAWIGMAIVALIFLPGGRALTLPVLAALSSSRGDDARTTREIEREAEHRRAERQAALFEREREDNRRRAAAEAARLEAERNAAYETKPAVEAGAKASEVAPEQETARESVPLETEKTEKPASNRIVKCRDEAGSMSYTQGYCPPGTKEVAPPKFE